MEAGAAPPGADYTFVALSAHRQAHMIVGVKRFVPQEKDWEAAPWRAPSTRRPWAPAGRAWTSRLSPSGGAVIRDASENHRQSYYRMWTARADVVIAVAA